MLHWKIHTDLMRVKPIQHEAEGRVLDWFNSNEEVYIFQCNMFELMALAFL